MREREREREEEEKEEKVQTADYSAVAVTAGNCWCEQCSIRVDCTI